MQPCPPDLSISAFVCRRSPDIHAKSADPKSASVNVHSVRIFLNHLAIISNVLTLSLQKTDVAVFLARPLVGGSEPRRRDGLNGVSVELPGRLWLSKAR